MARVLARAVRTRQRGVARTVSIPFGATVLRISPEDSARFVSSTARRRGTHNSRLRHFENLLVRHLADQYQRTVAGESAALAEALIAACDEPARRGAWGHNARRYAEQHFARTRVLARYEQLLAAV